MKWMRVWGLNRDVVGIETWSRRQESNLYLALRRHSFYPLNYGEGHFFASLTPNLRVKPEIIAETVE